VKSSECRLVNVAIAQNARDAASKFTTERIQSGRATAEVRVVCRDIEQCFRGTPRICSAVTI
jgi:hypothetical protein